MDKRHKMVLADLLAEVKLAEKKLGKVKAKLPVGESRIKQALVAGKRELAKKYALEFEEIKLQVKRAEQHLAICKKQYEAGKVKAQEAPTQKALGRMVQMSDAMNKMADSLDVANDAEDMVRKLEEDAAVADARLDIAVDSARMNNPEIDMPPPTSATPEPLPPLNTAEDILKEFE